MTKKILFLFLFVLFLLVGCHRPTQFSNEALQEKFLGFNQQELTFKTILSKHKGNKILIDVWASWCSDCIVTLSDLKKLQEENPAVHFVFLSLDKSIERWKKSVERLQITGDYYYIKK